MPEEIIQFHDLTGNGINHISGWLFRPPPVTKKVHLDQRRELIGMTEERGHKTEDCIALRQEVENMLLQGHLKELLSDRGRTNFARGREYQGLPKPPSPARTINMIIGGSDDASINSMKFTTTHKLKQSITHEQYDELEENITFDKSDANGLTFTHNEALVITLRILDTNVKCIMIDDGRARALSIPECSPK
uniref:Uncharacterized protein n=1 Tax=Nicotiana tabacum TaxID=4097 RepID=A0A1S4BIE6_TOBAC|nr:PREDICTED: uncharacterized protein LOC107808638 [Nicotiana tabacum]